MPSALGIAFFHKQWGAYEANPLIESDPLKKARQLLASAGAWRVQRNRQRSVDARYPHERCGATKGYGNAITMSSAFSALFLNSAASLVATVISRVPKYSSPSGGIGLENDLRSVLTSRIGDIRHYFLPSLPSRRVLRFYPSRMQFYRIVARFASVIPSFRWVSGERSGSLPSATRDKCGLN